MSNLSRPAGSGSKKKTSPGDVASRFNPNPSAAFTSTPTSHVDISLKLSAKSGFSKSNKLIASSMMSVVSPADQSRESPKSSKKV